MEDAYTLKYNTEEVLLAFYNLLLACNIQYNDCYWQCQDDSCIKEDPHPEVWDVNLLLTPIMLHSERLGSAPLYNLNISTPMEVTGNSVFVAKASGSFSFSLNDLIMTSNYNSAVRPMKIDDWGILFSRMTSYGEWEGGIYTTPYLVVESFRFKTEDVISATFKNVNVDEDNTTLFDGFYVNKVIRIPSTGVTNKTVGFLRYVYTFNDYGAPTPLLYILDYDKILNNLANAPFILHEGNFYKEEAFGGRDYTSYEIDGMEALPSELLYPLSNTMFTSLSVVPKTSLTFDVKYSVGANTTNNYRHAAIVIQGGIMINFLLEPASDNRIYYGVPQDECYAKLENWYTDQNTGEHVFPYDYDYYFHTLGSIDLTDKYTSSVTYPEEYCILYPDDIEERFNITTSGSGRTGSVDSATITWGNKHYKVRYGISKLRTYTFTRK